MRWEILKKFSAENKRFFSYKDVIGEYPDKDRSYLSKVLAIMVEWGMLMKISRDLYHIIPLSVDPQTYSPDSRLVAKYMMKGKDYYIAFSSAMHIHGLAAQAGFSTMVVTDRQVQPSIKHIAGSKIQFIYHTWDRFFGYEEMWITNQEQVMVSDLEKTIIDAVTKPQLCAGIIEIVRAIYHSKESVDLEKLFFYLATNGSQVAKKRYLFLSDFLGMEWTSDHERMLEESGSSFSPLDPTGPDRGINDNRFGLKINIDKYTLMDCLESISKPPSLFQYKPLS
jgi:predicted transcriptional regulator of viral defense system